jgi:hypothetical protein
MLPMILGGMGAGLLKSELIDRPQANKQRQLAATTAELSPWTGMTPTMPNEANPLGSMLQGGLAGAQIAQGMQQPAAAPAPVDPTQNIPGTMVPKMGMPGSAWLKMGQGQMLA